MTRARDLSKLSNSQAFSVDNNFNVGINSSVPTATLDVRGNSVITGVLTATSFSGTVDATGLTGTPDITVNNIVGAAATFSGVVTYEDVTNVDSVGVITARSDVSIADKIIHTGDTNTAIRFPAADTFTVETGGTERVRVDSSGRLLVGTDTTITDTNFGIGKLQATNKDGYQHVLFSGHSASAANATALSVGRSRGSQSSPGYLSSGDHIARFSAISYNGGNYQSSGCIDFYAADQHASNDLPGYIVFNTVPDGSATLTERIRITSAGLIGIGTNNPARLLHLHEESSDGVLLSFTNTTTGVTGGDGAVFGIQDNESIIISNKENNHIELHTNNTERLRITSAGNVSIQNDTGRFTAGASDDLEVYHNGTDSVIESSTGDLYLATINSGDDVIIKAVDDVIIQTAGTENAIVCSDNGAVKLYHNNVEVFQTYSEGIKVIGNEGTSAGIRLEADQGDDNGDTWRINSNQDVNDLTISNDTSGSLVDKLTLTTGGNLTVTGTVSDSIGNLRSLVKNSQNGGSTYTLVAGDAGKIIDKSNGGGVTVPNGVLSAGDMVTILNNSGSDFTITQGSSFSLYNTSDASTGNKTLAGRGIATIYFLDGGNGYISGSGMS